MTVTFQLRFHTHPGQSLLLAGDHPLLGNGEPARAIPLVYRDSDFWQLALFFAAGTVPKGPITYDYILRQPDGTLLEDWGRGRTLDLAAFNLEQVVIIDSWNSPGFFENAFYTEPFKQVLLRGNRTEVPVPPLQNATHTFKVKAPLLSKGQTVCLLGNTPGLRRWNTQDPIPLGRADTDDYFTVQLDLSQTALPIEYKYGVYDIEARRFVRYEDGANRRLLEPAALQKHVVVNDGFVVLPSTTWKGAGVAIPVFSLRSRQSFGIGEFNDLKLLADWCQQTGLKLIQILPVNDTIATQSWLDSYPYAAISAFALHPIYLHLNDLVSRANQPLLRDLEAKQAELNSLDAVDYEAVLAAKLGFIKQIYPSQQAPTFETKEFQTFFQQNRDWLVPYACFSFLRDKFGTPDCSQWPVYRRFSPEEMAQLSDTRSPDYHSIATHYFIQYHLHRQLKRVTDYIHSKGVVLKGDIAIGVHRHGVDTWQNPELFHMEMQAGAPPDAFGIKGQNWSFPTYNWPRMQEDGFSWWKRRFEQMGRYFDAFRIDHILGFFRIWSVPRHAVEGILGYFVPALPVEVSELEGLGIDFDARRYVEPWITDESLNQLFGKDAPAVKDRFLVANGAGGYRLKTAFAMQRQVEEFFATQESNELNQKLKQGLFDLITDVILLEPQGSAGRRFHFRFGMENTFSFQALAGPVQARLKDLYVDYFYRRQDSFWMKEGLKKLPSLKRATSMLICGEDLGMVPACVPELMKHLGLLSLEVQRMPKNLGQEFFRPKDAPYLSVITPSTHDMSTVRGWWQEDRSIIQRFYNQELELPGVAPETCEPWVNQRIVQQHLASPAMWTIFQLQDLLGMDEHLRRRNPDQERINVPANPRNYWRYRMHLTLEQLVQSAAFNQGLKGMLLEAYR